MTQANQEVTTRRRFNWMAAVWAGLIAGAAFLMIEMVLIALTGESPWGPPRMMAAIVLRQSVLPPPATFDMMIVAVAMMVHFPLSVAYALAFALAAARLSLWPAAVAGGVFGLALYVVNFYGFTALFPWFAMARNLVSIFGHAMFGIALALAYKALVRS